MWGEGGGGNKGGQAGWSEQGDGGAFTDKRKHWGETGVRREARLPVMTSMEVHVLNDSEDNIGWALNK